ncbi:MAG: hypothetical protein RQM92_04250 [Candidatus Syntrophopropionicum ammoniitolerans]
MKPRNVPDHSRECVPGGVDLGRYGKLEDDVVVIVGKAMRINYQIIVKEKASLDDRREAAAAFEGAF